MVTTPQKKIPSPADAPTMTAQTLIRRVLREGGHVFRMRELCVFVLTENPELATWLLRLGGVPYLPHNAERTPDKPLGAFRNSKNGPPKWDIYIHPIPVLGEQTVWEAAAKRNDVELFELS